MIEAKISSKQSKNQWGQINAQHHKWHELKTFQGVESEKSKGEAETVHILLLLLRPYKAVVSFCPEQ